jgi:hypothetical protein
VFPSFCDDHEEDENATAKYSQSGVLLVEEARLEEKEKEREGYDETFSLATSSIPNQIKSTLTWFQSGVNQMDMRMDDSQSSCTVEVYGIDGAIQQSFRWQNEPETVFKLDLSMYASGLYLVMVRGEGFSDCVRIVVQ